jgi:hypothetical protein
MWSLQDLFHEVNSKNDERAKVKIRFLGRSYEGWVTSAKHGRSSPAYRLWYEEDLSLKLKYTFLMSYMRSLEQQLSVEKKNNIEKEIPFWEFLDIEFDKINKIFIFVAYYKQEPSFPNLFERLIDSPGIKRISDELNGNKEKRIYKQDWKKREQLAYEIGANNVLYLLLDTQNKSIYVGEASDLISRLNQPHPSIPHWDYFRYNVLPNELAPYRVALERMFIRDLAAFLPSKKSMSTIVISEYKLANDKIDK